MKIEATSAITSKNAPESAVLCSILFFFHPVSGSNTCTVPHAALACSRN